MYNRAFALAVEIRPHYIGFNGNYTASVYNSAEQCRRDGYRPTIYKDQYGYTIWEYCPEWCGINRKCYYLDYAVVLPVKY